MVCATFVAQEPFQWRQDRASAALLDTVRRTTRSKDQLGNNRASDFRMELRLSAVKEHLRQGTFFCANYCPFDPNWKQNAMSKLSDIAFIITIMAPLPAVAYTQTDADACTADAMRLCWNAIPDASRVTQCLVQNKQQLGPACSNVFNRPRGARVDRERPIKAQGTMY